MTIDWNQFTPYASLVGGLLIGLAAGALVLLGGRIAGISGILGGLLAPQRGGVGWRLAFVGGLLAAPLLHGLWAAPTAPVIGATPAVLVAAGLAVGLGTRFGAGCTSGHGVCGLSRLSPRSLVATATFMLAGFATVFIVRHALAI